MTPAKAPARDAPRVLEGWTRIAKHVARRTGLDVTPDAVARWSQLERDPLPVRRFALERRSRIVADVEALDRWCDSRWKRPPAPRRRRDG